QGRPGQIESATQCLGDRPVRLGIYKPHVPVDADVDAGLCLHLVVPVGCQADTDRTVCPGIVRYPYLHYGLQSLPGGQGEGLTLELHAPATVSGMCCQADLCGFAATVVYADSSCHTLAKELVGSHLCCCQFQVQ